MIEQARLAGVGPAGDHDLVTVPEKAPAAGGVEQRNVRPAAGLEPLRQRLVGEKIHVVVGEIDGCFDVHAQLDELPLQFGARRGKGAGERAQRGLCGLLRAAGDEIGNRFGLGKVELVIEKRAFGELPRPGAPGAVFDGSGDQRLNDDRPAVAVQFDDVFAREGSRRRKPQHEAEIDCLTVARREASLRRLPGRRQGARDPLADGCRLCAGQAHDGDAAAAAGRGGRDDGLGPVAADAMAHWQEA